MLVLESSEQMVHGLETLSDLPVYQEMLLAPSMDFACRTHHCLLVAV
jgi:hypothetical protein